MTAERPVVNYFFARKFDSFIDAEPIYAAEKQALRFHPELLQKIESSPVLNSTWINLYDSEIDYGNFSFDSFLMYLFRSFKSAFI